MRGKQTISESARALALGGAVMAMTTGTASATGLYSDGGPSAWELSANVSLTTDYIFRGASQTDEGPAVQGGFDFAYQGLYGGVWASNLDFGGGVTGAGEMVDVANVEIDYFAGIKKSLNGVDLDFGAIYYTYPNAFDPTAELDYWELKFAVGRTLWHGIGAGVAVYWSPDYTGEAGDTVTLEGALNKDLGGGWGVSGALGYVDNLDGNAILVGADDYVYWNAGVSKTFRERYTVDLRYWDTDVSGCGSVALFQCDARVVATLSAAF